MRPSPKALGRAGARRYSRDWLLNQQAKGDLPPKELEYMDGVSMTPADQRVRLQCCAAQPTPLPRQMRDGCSESPSLCCISQPASCCISQPAS